MQKAIKHLVEQTYKPLLVRYLSKTTWYHSGNIRLAIPPDVFHPRFFYSTKILRQYIDSLPLKGRSLLELGAGSGLISIAAAKKGAIVTATDINPVAIEWLKKNSAHNMVSLRIIQSDLFDDIPLQEFDIIAINPPYYKKHPVSNIDHAWYCGENGEYFQSLFCGLQKYRHDNSEIIMTLCDGCDIKMIETIAGESGFFLHCIQAKQNLLEKTFVFRIELRS